MTASFLYHKPREANVKLNFFKIDPTKEHYCVNTIVSLKNPKEQSH